MTTPRFAQGRPTRRHEELSEDGLVRVGLELSSSLAAAHRVGLAHRDIKPALLVAWATIGPPGARPARWLDASVSTDLVEQALHRAKQGGRNQVKAG
jgi:hypothetical protein